MHSCKDLDDVLMQMVRLAKREWEPKVYRQVTIKDGNTRYLAVQVKAEVWERDKGRCQNCGSAKALEYDHLIPFAKGGKTTLENLRLLCRNCNQRKGLKDFPQASRRGGGSKGPWPEPV